MLSRKVCRKCREIEWGDKDPENKPPDYGLPKIWYCPHTNQSFSEDNLTHVTDDSIPPNWCPYKLEHGIAEALKG